ncbi:hypothetical protein GGS21DRAFT_501810 [Xylaria nigripes]|nr:hypothetical protein GGS21DRAFT_501810 [Xylaria nigripes]
MSTTTRRRQNSAAGRALSLSLHTRQKSKAHPEPKSAHISDPFLHSFLEPTFSPADYLNSTLPSLQTSSRNNDPKAVTLAELSAQAQTQLSQLNAHTTRLTNTLTQLTDDILRSGSRLAYEVELLRGETLSLSEALTDRLNNDIVKFVPDGLQEQAPDSKGGNLTATATSQSTASTSQRRASVAISALPPVVPPIEESSSIPPPADTVPNNPTDPTFITQLQTLTLVRSRLDTVVKTFGDAMEFVFPPSEVSVSSSFLSVSAPEPGSKDRSTEEKGQKVLQQFRDDITNLLNAGPEPADGIEKAAQRIEELKDLTTVWKGTAEEKGRTKFIDSLAKMVEDRHKDLMREMEQAGRKAEGGETGQTRPANASLDAAAAESRGLSGYGIMSQLQRLRSGL